MPKIITETEIRLTAARRAFWSNHPLVDAYRKARQVEDVPLADLIEFVSAMPQPEFNAAMFKARGRS